VTEDTFEIICDGCGRPVAANAPVCPSCGRVLIETARPVRPAPAPAPFRRATPLRASPSAGVAPAAATPLSEVEALPSKAPTPESIVAAATAAEKPKRRYAPGSGEFPRSAFGGFWIRAVALLIDGALLFALLVVLHKAVGEPAAAITVAAVAFLYFPLMEGSKSQATLGKGMCALAVTDTRGCRISYGHAFGRCFAKILSAALAGIGFLIAAVTPKKRALHDFLAGTLVLRRGMY
jgi:uncharacterized RDD family membrane protein YckC